MENPNRFGRRWTDGVRPLASIPNKDGFVLIGVHKDGTRAQLTVYVDANGHHKVPGYENLTGWVPV